MPSALKNLGIEAMAWTAPHELEMWHWSCAEHLAVWESRPMQEASQNCAIEVAARISYRALCEATHGLDAC